jgi:hypothetical protein
MHHRVNLPDGSSKLMPNGGDKGADGELQYMGIAQDLDRSPEGPKANLADEGKPRIIDLYFFLFKVMQLFFVIFEHLCFRGWN